MSSHSPENDETQLSAEKTSIDYRGLYVDAQIETDSRDARGRTAAARKIIEASHAAADASGDWEVAAIARKGEAFEQFANTDIGPHPWQGHEYSKSVKKDYTSRAIASATASLKTAKSYQQHAGELADEAFVTELRLQDQTVAPPADTGILGRLKQWWARIGQRSRRN